VIVGAVCSLAMLVSGALYAAGFFKVLAVTGVFGLYTPLGAGWFGLGGLFGWLALSLTPVAGTGPLWAGGLVAVLVVTSLCGVVGVVGVVWVPRFLRPAWLRTWVDAGRPDAVAARWRPLGRGTRW